MKYWIIVLLLCFTCLPAYASEFKWIDTHGEMHALADLKGEPVVLHVWASWCPPCRSELPGFAAWLNRYPDINIIPISLDNTIEEVSSFLSSKNIEIPALLSDTDQAQQLGIRGLPTTLLIAADGSISQHHIGSHNWDDTAFTKQLSDELLP